MVSYKALNTIHEGRDATVLIVFMELKCNYKAMSSTIIPLVPSSFALRYISIMLSLYLRYASVIPPLYLRFVNEGRSSSLRR